MKEKIVIIDDEVKLLKALKRALELEGYEVFDFTEPDRGFEFISGREISLVISDIRMKGMNGIELLRKTASILPELPFILMTAHSSVETAVTAVKLGAADYLLKPFELSDFKEAVKKVLGKTQEKEPEASGYELIGASNSMKTIHKLIERISDTDSAVLLNGESGTGKELVARAIHKNSPRKESRFVAVNCSAIPETLFESEMFGHKKGSFTNAITDKHGLFKEADGGTLFLDEIADLTLPNQAKLLRVLQDGTFKPVGETREFSANVRVISASNKQLTESVGSGKFREDLLYRINVIEINIPPLRNRKEDIMELAQYFIKKFSHKHSRNVQGATKDFFEALESYNWPGNVRQLENCIERAIIMKRGGLLTQADIDLPLKTNQEMEIYIDKPLADTMNEIEESIIMQALEKCNWNYSRAASSLGVTRQNLHYKLKKYGINKQT